jgi:hypothetical protein
MYPKAQKGFIALTSVSIVAAVVLILCAALSIHGLYTRTSLLSFENKLHSEENMRGCVSYILQQLAQNATYRGNEITNINGSSCTITASTGGDPRIYGVTTTYHHAYTTWQVAISLSTLDVLSRYEVP